MAARPEDVRPGPPQGQVRNFVAPNFGTLGGRPSSTTSPTASPMETLPDSLPDFMQPAPQPQAQQAAPQAPEQKPAEEAAPQPAPAPTPEPVPAAPAATQPAAPQEGAPVAAGPATMFSPQAPKDFQLVPDGTKVSTPLGTSEIRGGVAGDFTLSPQGRQAYGHAKMARIQKFGRHPWSDDPRAPQPPIEPGAWAFNAFSGDWSNDD